MKKKRLVAWHKSIIFKQMVIFVFTLFTSLVIFMAIYYTFQTETIGTTSEVTASRDGQILNELENRINEIEFQIYDLYSDGNLQLLCELWEFYDERARASKIINVQERIQRIQSKDNYMTNLRVYSIKNDKYVTANGYGEISSERKQELRNYMDVSNVSVVEDGNIHIYFRSLSNGLASTNVRYISEFEIAGQRFRNLLNELKADELSEGILLANSELYMHNVEGDEKLEAVQEYYLTHTREMENLETFDISVAGERYFCSVVRLELVDITLLTVRSYGQVFGQMMTLFRILPVVFGLNIIAIIFFLFYINRYVNRPVMILGEAFISIQDDDNYLIEDAFAKDEFGILYHGFNEMSRRLLENITQNYKQKIELQRAQLKQLQAQIDPHFLYNTLFVLRTRVHRKDYEGVEELSGLLGDYFHFLNRDARDFISLQDEVDHTYVYAHIQATRYVERFMFIGDPCPEEYQDVSVPRLILQPLIENAVKYEVETSEKEGLIHVYFEKEGSKLVVIMESSAYISEDDIRRLNEYINSGDQDGEVTSTINICRRLQLYYGKGYTLHYKKSKYGGLKSVIELDYRKRVEI